jgi:hypothetical protein
MKIKACLPGGRPAPVDVFGRGMWCAGCHLAPERLLRSRDAVAAIGPLLIEQGASRRKAGVRPCAASSAHSLNGPADGRGMSAGRPPALVAAAVAVRREIDAGVALRQGDRRERRATADGSTVARRSRGSHPRVFAAMLGEFAASRGGNVGAPKTSIRLSVHPSSSTDRREA